MTVPAGGSGSSTKTREGGMLTRLGCLKRERCTALLQGKEEAVEK